MYLNGLHFPIFFIFLNDNLIINNLEDVINQKTNFLVASEEDTNNAIIEFINQNKGYEIYPYLLNNFAYILQTNLKINESDITSKFIELTEFKYLIRNFKIDFLKINNSITELEKISQIDKSSFYNELFKLLFKSFSIKLGKIINYSDYEESKLFLDFDTDYRKFLKFSAELEKTRPKYIKKYDYKKNYVISFFNSFKTNDLISLENKIEDVKCHSDKEILRTFGKLIKKTVIVNEGIDPRTRNKVFKPIFKQINSAISDKTYSDNKLALDALTKNVKDFLASIY